VHENNNQQVIKITKQLSLSTDRSSREPSARQVHRPLQGVMRAVARDAKMTCTVTYIHRESKNTPADYQL